MTKKKFYNEWVSYVEIFKIGYEIKICLTQYK